MQEGLYERLVKICGKKNISRENTLLNIYSKDLSFAMEKKPFCIIWPSNSAQIEEIIKLANKIKFSIIPISSSSKSRYNGDTIPKKENTIIMNLSKMNKILNIDRKNRVLMIEPGVTFGQIIPLLHKKGLRLLTPLHPRANKSVIASALEREPIIIPRLHWDSSDPLLCTEVIFGTGKLFRTGSAAGPGRISEMKKSGQAQVNPMGPTQFSPFRLIQGSQGSLGVVTWATIKLELFPTIQKVFHLQSDDIEELLKLQQNLLKNRYADELFIVNNLNFACLLRKNSKNILNLANRLKKWNLIYVLSGRGKLAEKKISYQEEDINEIIDKLRLKKIIINAKLIGDDEILKILNEPTNNPWRLRLYGGFQSLFFITSLNRIKKFISIIETIFSTNLGIYIQAINQGTAYHVEFDIYYHPEDEIKLNELREKYYEAGIKLLDNGAFFNRPYLWAKEVFKRHSEQTTIALNKIKKIFDPNNVLNPGVLCFDL
ncbi:MAG: FAD-binding protein [Promethearchaeia archaeon]